MEIEEPVEPEPGGRTGADRRRHLRPRRAPGGPAGGHAYDHAGLLEIGDARQQARSFLRTPAQRMEDLAAVDHRPQPRAGLGGTPHRHQQRQQPVAVGCAGIFAQCLTVCVGWCVVCVWGVGFVWWGCGLVVVWGSWGSAANWQLGGEGGEGEAVGSYGF